MPPGGRREGAGRPRGSKDSPLVITRALTAAETQAVLNAAQVVRAQTRLDAWNALAHQIQNIDKLPAKERAGIIALALKYSEDRPTRPGVTVNVNTDGEPSGTAIMWSRLRALHAGADLDAVNSVKRWELPADPDRLAIDAAAEEPHLREA